jgi:AcrR family transcriptional regulator
VPCRDRHDLRGAKRAPGFPFGPADVAMHLLEPARRVHGPDHGSSGTTVAAIAARAQVTPQAVHLAVGGKAAPLVRAVEVTVAGATDDEPLADRAAFADVYAPDLPARRRLAALAAATSDIYGRAARLFLVLTEAAASDPTAAELAAQASARRLADHRRLAELLAPMPSPPGWISSPTRSGSWPAPPSTSASCTAATGPPPGTPPGSTTSSTMPAPRRRHRGDIIDVSA